MGLGPVPCPQTDTTSRWTTGRERALMLHPGHRARDERATFRPGAERGRARGELARTQQQLHALLEQDLLCFLPDTGQELLVGEGHLGVNESDLGTNEHRTEKPLSLLLP